MSARSHRPPSGPSPSPASGAAPRTTPPRIGVYEKALPPAADWHGTLAHARAAGFDFIEIAVDESAERRARLGWTSAEIAALQRASLAEGLPVHTVILSALRAVPLASPDAGLRDEAAGLLAAGIAFAARIGARILQVPGYYSFDRPAGPDGAARFTEALAAAAETASAHGVMLGIETMDGEDVTSVRAALAHVEAVRSPWLALYPDVGNLAANGHDVDAELRAGAGRLVGVHLKDARPGAFRRVPFGEGVVPFARAFATLARLRYPGPFLIEMWNDGAEDADATLREALRFVRAAMAEGGYAIGGGYPIEGGDAIEGARAHR